jgi:hypothetical protein
MIDDRTNRGAGEELGGRSGGHVTEEGEEIGVGRKGGDQVMSLVESRGFKGGRGWPK